MRNSAILFTSLTTASHKALNTFIMKNLQFHITYHTYNDCHPELVYSVDGGDTQYLSLQSNDNTLWQTSLKVAPASKHIRYAYQIVNNDNQLVRVEPNNWRIFYFNHRTDVCFFDTWTEHAMSSIYHREAFEKCILQPCGGERLHMDLITSPYLLLLHALPPTDNLRWAVIGSTKRWGNWQTHEARLLQRTGTYEWALPLSRKDFEEGVSYKYVLIDTTRPDTVIWEQGGNRELIGMPYPEKASAIRQDEMPQIDMPLWHGAGCVIPVFSLRSQTSSGIGDFGDLCKFVHWAAEVGMRAVQLLPINDTTRTGSWHDSYPYNGISVFALHPIYLDMREWSSSQAYATYQHEGEELNLLPQIDYERVFQLKTKFARALFKENGKRTIASAAFKKFYHDNEQWLTAYTSFCALRDLYHTADFRSWPADAPTPDTIEQFVHAHPQLEEARTYYAYVQFLLHCQMQQAHDEARKLGVILKGDIPIGISRDSVPTWVDGRLFHFNGQAGAPPDDFAVHGQNWGFPTYNWNEMAKDNYAWWRKRLHHMQQYFDAYRIDHVLGFFRIWEVPTNQIYGLLGYFRPALPFSISEIGHFGFTEDVASLCIPQVNEAYLQQLIAETQNEHLAEQYFEPLNNHSYTLKEGYRSQRALMQLLPEGKTRQALLNVACEVLFIQDPERHDLYHPRIAAQLTHLYTTLSDQNRDAFNRLHDDFFYHRNNQFWADEAMKKIPTVTQSSDNQHPTLQLYPLQGTGMLPCAEDLGMVPASVKGVLERLQILSLEIQRMPKEYGVRFGHLNNNPYLSVTTIATHDMPPLRLWWQQNAERRQAFWNEALHHEGEAPTEATPEICEEIIKQHLQSPSMLCLLALQDWLSISPTLRSKHPETEQINDPANPNQYWRYRMHLTIEELMQQSGFNDKIRALIAQRS